MHSRTDRGHAETGLSELAAKIYELSQSRWRGQRDTLLIGRHPRMHEAQLRLLQCAQADAPVLVTGETGTGKELFARSLHLLSRRRATPYLCVNCAQYVDGQLIASELFGHKKGAFTGAVADRRGIFEAADGGVVFLDEIGELSLIAQAMLLRALSEGEVLPVGDSTPRKVNVRVVAATSLDLRQQIARGVFREDLYYRLRYLQVRVPPLRERGGDWELVAEHYLGALGRASGIRKHFTDDARDLLQAYEWPGNVRELRGIVETAYHVSESSAIEPRHFEGELHGSHGAMITTGQWSAVPAMPASLPAAPLPVPAAPYAPVPTPPLGVAAHAPVLVREMRCGASFWDVVYEPFMARDLSRREVRAVIENGLEQTRGSYKRLLTLFHVEQNDYLRFMDFLRHHRLKPDRAPDLPTELAGLTRAGDGALASGV